MTEALGNAGLRWLLASGLLGAVTTGCVPSPPSPRPPAVPRSAPVTGPGTDIPNYARASKALWRGGQPTRHGFAVLKRHGIRTVVCLRVTDIDRELLSGHGFRYRHISFKHAHPEDEDVLTFLKIVTDPDNQPVFVHCREGVDRTGMMVAAYRIIVQGWTEALAVAEMRHMGFHDLNWFIERYLDRLDVPSLKRKLADTPSPDLEVVP